MIKKNADFNSVLDDAEATMGGLSSYENYTVQHKMSSKGEIYATIKPKWAKTPYALKTWLNIFRNIDGLEAAFEMAQNELKELKSAQNEARRNGEKFELLETSSTNRISDMIG